MVKGKVQVLRSPNISWSWLSAKLSLASYSFINSSNCYKLSYLARIHFIFLNIALDQAWKTFVAKFRAQSKEKKSCYQVRQILRLSCKLAALILF